MTVTDTSNLAYAVLSQTQRQRVSDGAMVPVLGDNQTARYTLMLVWPQLGDFDSLEYAWWLQRETQQLEEQAIQVRAVGIGNRRSGQAFCDYTGFPPDSLMVDPTADLHRQLNLYGGLSARLPGLSSRQNAWINLLLMCAGVGSPGTLREVLRGYTGDRQAPQLIGDDQTVNAPPLPPISGSVFRFAGGTGFQRPFELATLRLRNMGEVLGHWSTYVPDPTYMPQRGGTFLFDAAGSLVYNHRDRGILGFAKTMGQPLAFLASLTTADGPA